VSIENVIAFGKLVMGDEKLRSELASAVKDKNSDEAANSAAALATRHGYPCTPDEVKDGYQAYMQGGLTGTGGELSDAQLEAVAGGPGPGNKGGGPSPSQDFNQAFGSGGGKGGGK
jgi:predicted ribosomally synthesized peptide with nif11-like leader